SALDDVSTLGNGMLEIAELKSQGLLEHFQQECFKRSVAKSIERLAERERRVLSLYYEEELTLKEVGVLLGVSESRISQIHAQAVTKLKDCLKEWEEPITH